MTRALDTARRCLLRRLAGVATACALALPHARADGLRRFELRLARRALATGADTLRVTQGDAVEIGWVSDEPVRLHLHGYDVALDLDPGAPGLMRVQASLIGRFPIAAHGPEWRHAPLAYLEVHPR